MITKNRMNQTIQVVAVNCDLWTQLKCTVRKEEVWQKPNKNKREAEMNQREEIKSSAQMED